MLPKEILEIRDDPNIGLEGLGLLGRMILDENKILFSIEDFQSSCSDQEETTYHVINNLFMLGYVKKYNIYNSKGDLEKVLWSHKLIEREYELSEKYQ